jgi:hypothetical protein
VNFGKAGDKNNHRACNHLYLKPGNKSLKEKENPGAAPENDLRKSNRPAALRKNVALHGITRFSFLEQPRSVNGNTQ